VKLFCMHKDLHRIAVNKMDFGEILCHCPDCGRYYVYDKRLDEFYRLPKKKLNVSEWDYD